MNENLRYRIDTVRFPDGSIGTYTYIDSVSSSAGAVALEKRRGQRGAYLIKQERYPSRSTGWEIPAGSPMPGENQLQTAQRELREEAGLEAELWQPLPRQIENIGRGNTWADVFMAAGITAVTNHIDASEVITDQRWFSMPEIEDLMLDKQISSGHTLASLALANAALNRHPEYPISRMAG